jgi:hypothetical protein
MSAFDSATKIGRAVGDPLTDGKLPHPKSLSWAAITTSTAVIGTNGTHCELVHGDRWHEIRGNHNENIAANQTIKVVGKHKETIVESCYQNTIGPHIVMNCNVRNETRLGTYTEVYGDQEIQKSGEDGWDKKKRKYERYTFHHELNGEHVEIAGFLGTVIAANLQLGITQATVSVFKNALDGFKFANAFLLQEIFNLASDIGMALRVTPSTNAAPETHEHIPPIPGIDVPAA